MDCLSLYHHGVQQLTASEIDNPELESALFLADILDVSRSAVLLNLPTCHKLQADCFFKYIRRRCSHEPFAYIVGTQEFWSLEFKVTPDVLIPRPETELIIEHFLDHFPQKEAVLHLLDCGTGSGILPITLATIYSKLSCTAIDISAKALMVAKENSVLHGVFERIVFTQDDFTKPLTLKNPFDVIVSNPPYVDACTYQSLQEDVVGFEPHLALDGGVKGFDLVAHLLKNLHHHLKPGGHLFMEIGYDQQQSAMELLRSLPFYGQYKVHQDYAGLPRMIHAIKNEQ
jgi:release factor glutamine methyltransferase